jgi:hypothetical protein
VSQKTTHNKALIIPDGQQMKKGYNSFTTMLTRYPHSHIRLQVHCRKTHLQRVEPAAPQSEAVREERAAQLASPQVAVHAVQMAALQTWRMQGSAPHGLQREDPPRHHPQATGPSFASGCTKPDTQLPVSKRTVRELRLKPKETQVRMVQMGVKRSCVQMHAYKSCAPLCVQGKVGWMELHVA